jgi:signal transduction histidine kinase
MQPERPRQRAEIAESAEAARAGAIGRRLNLPAWPRVSATVLLALSTYFLRFVLARVGLQALTFIVPGLAAAYAFGSRMSALASALSLVMAHVILWRTAPGMLFTPSYFSGIANFAIISILIYFYTRRHERVLERLDRSLARETIARAHAESASRLKDQFLATLSHELRTPMNVVLGYLQRIRADESLPHRREIEIVHRNAQQQARLLEDMLDASRIITGTFRFSPERINPDVLMRDAIESLRPAIAGKQLQLAVELHAREDIHADPDRIRQVFWNLLSNAVKFTPAGGRIGVRSEHRRGAVFISVSDNGRGIAPGFLPHVFDMFRQGDASFTREVSGIGLGLSLDKQFVELQGGEVTVESAGEGRGATFTCRFSSCGAADAAPAYTLAAESQ